MRISKSQVVNFMAVAGGVAASIYAYTAPGGHVHLPAYLAWVPGVAAAVAGLSRSLVPQLSGVPGQQPNVIPTASHLSNTTSPSITKPPAGL